MPLVNTLNISELLRRLGVKGDSLGSAPLLESLRLSLLIGDLSDLVPPVGTPFGGGNLISTSGVGTFTKFALRCLSPGGLTMTTLRSNIAGTFRIWVEPNPFGPLVATTFHNFSFGQAVLSRFLSFTPGAQQAPLNALEFSQNARPSFGQDLPNWIGPTEQLNIESQTANVTNELSITWKEYPAALNPG